MLWDQSNQFGCWRAHFCGQPSISVKIEKCGANRYRFVICWTLSQRWACQGCLRMVTESVSRNIKLLYHGRVDYEGEFNPVHFWKPSLIEALEKKFKGVFRRWQGGATDTASDIIVVVDLRNVMRTPAWTLPCLLAGRVWQLMGLGFHFKCPFQVGAQVPCCPSTRNLVTRMVREANLNLAKMQARQRQHPSLSGPDKTLAMGGKAKKTR